MYKIIYNLNLGDDKLSDNKTLLRSDIQDACAIANFISSDDKSYNVKIYDNSNNVIYIVKENGKKVI